MVTNFEEITEDLTEQEMKIVKDVENLLREILQGKKLKQPIVVHSLNIFLDTIHGPTNHPLITTVRLRKYFNYFRTKGIIPIIATSDGCYITEDKAEIEKQIKSLEQRANSIRKAAEGMKKLLIN